MMNLKLIERSSRSRKDPSPISCAMSTVELKYPISVDRSKAIEHKIPIKFLCPTKHNREDHHTHDRILCRKEAIDWWVSESEVPNERVKEVMTKSWPVTAPGSQGVFRGRGRG
jgi:hypothetical protein